MAKQVGPASGKPITTVAFEADAQRLASTRADFHTGPGAQAPPNERPKIRLQSAPGSMNHDAHLARCHHVPRRVGRVKAKPPFGRCASRSLDPTYATRPSACTRRRQAFVAADGASKKAGIPVN